MDRKSFLRSIVLLAVAPKIIAEMDYKPPMKAPSLNGQIVKDLQLLTPAYYKSFVEKYGNDDFIETMQHIGQHADPMPNYFWFENRRIS